MPTYEYKCTECGEHFDVQQSIKDDTLTTLAGSEHEHQVKKVFHPVGISFKGDGFYKNDARSSSSSTKTSADSGTSSSDTSNSSADASKSDKTKSDSSAKSENGSGSSSSSEKSQSSGGSDSKAAKSSGTKKTSSKAKSSN